MKTIIRKTVPAVLLSGLIMISWCWAAEDSPVKDDGVKPSYDLLFEQAKEAFGKDRDSFRFEPVKFPDYLDDEKLKASYRKAWQGYYDYLSVGLAYRIKVFRWQGMSTVIIFYTVIILVFAGILFSGVQFYKSMKYAGMSKSDGRPDQPLTEFEASASGVRISSPVLGVVILVISLVFFYLYLVHVYPIQEIF